MKHQAKCHIKSYPTYDVQRNMKFASIHAIIIISYGFELIKYWVSSNKLVCY